MTDAVSAPDSIPVPIPISILIVDDDPSEIELLSLAFEENHMAVQLQIARDGKGALSVLQGQQPRLAMIDIKMPLMNGFELLQAIRADPRTRGLTVIIMSTSGAESDRRQARELGAVRYWQKPPHFHELVAMVQELKPLLGDRN